MFGYYVEGFDWLFNGCVFVFFKEIRFVDNIGCGFFIWLWLVDLMGYNECVFVIFGDVFDFVWFFFNK